MPIDSEKILVTIDKSYYEKIRVAIVGIDGREYISLGVFRKEGEEFVRGVTLAPQVVENLLPILKAAVAEIKHGGAAQ